MAYTKDHLAQVEQAIVDLARGERVVEVRFGPNDSTRYATAELPQLLELRDTIKAEVLAAGNGRRIRGYRLNHSRGL
ncbi:phage tail protein [Pseudomonas sp. PDM18]|uniref:phage tail protein n=1 Tax=Pseudomonas sp. PDM18 TaxID=2769253 RepID=UPI00177F7C5E|nr:phage tail protein [Pseudomonas sp. PDM18]MBD9675538.1 phage tail protein [Pseudomonas sp. PDM18]